jgi:hypothetical protein
VSRRLAILAAWAPLLLLLPPLAVTPAASAAVKWRGGVVPDVPTGTYPHPAPRARIANLPYGGGPVMHANRTHVIFWQPSGSGLGYDPGYQALIETFLARVAADSRKPGNVYGLSGQYHDAAGPAAYNSSYAGAVLATDRLPPNGCSEPPSTGPGWTDCLSDSQLEAEIQHVISADRLPTGMRDIYFLVLPGGLGTCMGTGPDSCALGGTASGSFCGYHSTNADQTVLYAVIPYNAVSGHCQSGNPRPNASTADPALSTISHEHNEVVTDPLGDAWVDSRGNENGDLCIYQYGPNLGGSGAASFNEVIHGGHYYLQEEWSNETGSCQPREAPDQVSFTAPARVRVRKPAAFTGRARPAHGSIVAFDWFFGDGGRAHRRATSHLFRRAGRFRVVLRTTDSSGNWAFFARALRVMKAAAKDNRRRR